MEKRENTRRINLYTRETDVFDCEKREKDRRASIALEKKIIEKIEVRSPYYSLSNFEEIENGLKASIPIEQPLLDEVEPITVGETSRHLAILGSCAIALKRNAEKSFYLATKATYQRHIDKIKLENLELIGTAQVLNLDKRKATAHTQLITKENQVITSLDVEYTILSSEIFERQFKNHKLDLRQTNENISRQNFYKQFDFNPKLAKQTEDGIIFNIGEIKPEMCMGHFPMYPALPVAFSSNIVLNVAVNFLKKILNKKNIKVVFKKIFVEALQIIFNKTDVIVELKLLDSNENVFVFSIKLIEKNNNKLLIEFNPVTVEVFYV
jgi:hypothetical protein